MSEKKRTRDGEDADLSGKRVRVPRGDDDIITTIHVAGFPANVRSRELRNLVRFLPGYEGSSLSFTGEKKQPVGFVKFSSPQAAIHAVTLLNGYQFDDKDSKEEAVSREGQDERLHVSIAKRNMTVRHPEPALNAWGADYSQAYMASYLPSAAAGGQLNLLAQTFGGMAAYPTPQIPQARVAQPESAWPRMRGIASRAVGAVPTESNTPPCDTLCVFNIPSDIQQRELEAIFARSQGFKAANLLTKRDNPVAFVRFDSIEDATTALQAINGAILEGTYTPLIVQYARRSLKLAEER